MIPRTPVTMSPTTFVSSAWLAMKRLRQKGRSEIQREREREPTPPRVPSTLPFLECACYIPRSSKVWFVLATSKLTHKRQYSCDALCLKVCRAWVLEGNRAELWTSLGKHFEVTMPVSLGPQGRARAGGAVRQKRALRWVVLNQRNAQPKRCEAAFDSVFERPQAASKTGGTQ